MINIRTIRKLTDGDGFTLKYGKMIRYKTGWQVADYGIEITSAQEAITPSACLAAIAASGLKMEFTTSTILSV